MGKPIGLRTQLLVGLSVMMVVATVSVGAITVWATRYQFGEERMTGGRILGQGLARVLAAARTTGDPAVLERAVGTVAAWSNVLGLQLVDRGKRVLARRGQAPAEGDDSAVAQVLLTGTQRVRLNERGGRQSMTVFSPLIQGEAVSGVLRLELSLENEHLGWPVLFWVLMAFNAAVLVLFVGYVVTRYVIRPVERMQRSALALADGKLETVVDPSGAKELTSLAGSINIMTQSLRDQLHRLRRQQEELVVTREQVVHSEKLASVGRLAAGVAHEVGNPLQAIVGFTEMLLSDDPGPEQRGDFLRRIRSETQRIHRIVRELLDYARPVEDEVEAVDLAAVVEQAVQLVGPQRSLKQVDVNRGPLEQLPPVAANAQRMVQVILNLLLNAADAMEGQGKVSLDGRSDEREVSLSVSNDGPAIPAEDRGRVFDPFFSTKDPGEGTGLGLSVAQAIIESYGGRLSLLDRDQTTFEITLPIWSE